MLFEAEIPILFFKKNHLTPFRPKFTRIIPFFVGEKLLLSNAVVSGVFGLEQRTVFVKRLKHLPYGVFMSGIGRFRPTVVLNSKLFPQREEFGSNLLGK